MIRYEIKPLVIFSQHTEVYSVGLYWKGLQALCWVQW